MKVLKLKDYQSKDDITWKQWTEYAAAGSGDDVDLQFLTNRMLKVFYDISYSESKLLKADQVELLLTKLLLVLNQPLSSFKPLIYVDAKEYGFFNFSKMTYGELVDLDALREQNDWISIASIVYRPVISKNHKGEYRIEDYNGYDNQTMKDIPLSYVEGFQSLFTKSLNHLSQLIHTSTTTMEQTKMDQ